MISVLTIDKMLEDCCKIKFLIYSDVISTISASCNVDFDDAILKERVSFSSSVYDNLLYCEPISVNFLVTVSISEEDLSKVRF